MINIKIRIKNEEKDINPLNDFLFSKLFGEKGCDKETLYIINTFTGKKFKSLNYEPNEIKGEHKDNKKSITDVLVTTNDGTVVNIEVQLAKQENFHKRSHFYNAKISSILLKVGQNYDKLPMTIMINILNFTLWEEIEDYHTTFKPTEIKHKTHTIKDVMEIHYIELLKFRKKVKKGNIDLNNPIVRIVLFLDEKTPQELIEKVIEMDEFAKTICEKSTHILQDQKEYLAYIRAEQNELDQKAMIKYAKKKGRKEGREEEKVEVAIKLKKLDFPIEQISEVTGMSITKIKEI